MDFFGSYRSPFGYENGENGGIDSYGVDHSGFSTQDELQYQTLRTNREEKLAEDLRRRGVAEESYPQCGASFWGNRANNYGFGNSNISQNIQNVTNQLNNNEFDGGMNALQFSNNQSPIQQIFGGMKDMVSEYFKMKIHGYKNLDDYHHCKANYNAASRGPYGYNIAKTLGDAKEKFDFYWNQYYKGLNEHEDQKDRSHDLGVNALGRLRGDSKLYRNAQNACSDYRDKNPAFPKKYW